MTDSELVFHQQSAQKHFFIFMKLVFYFFSNLKIVFYLQKIYQFGILHEALCWLVLSLLTEKLQGFFFLPECDKVLNFTAFSKHYV